MPILARTVSHAIAASRDHPSKCRPFRSPESGKKWSQVQIESAPSSSARRHPSRSSSTEQCCGSNCTPTLKRCMGSSVSYCQSGEPVHQVPGSCVEGSVEVERFIVDPRGRWIRLDRILQHPHNVDSFIDGGVGSCG